MIAVKEFVGCLTEGGVDFFTGVPDSLLKNFCAYVTDHFGDNHVIAANEGGAVGLAAGHYLATGKLALVYMQNSGQGNAVNPLASLADPDVYSIPMVLLVGWRGQPGVHDEPQHVKQGKITVSLMETLGIPATVLADEGSEGSGGLGGLAGWRNQVSSACELAMREKRPVALVVKKGLFDEYKLQNRKPDIAELPREKAIELVLDSLPADAVIVSTTGMISRELYEIRERKFHSPTSAQNSNSAQCHSHDFLTVGSMGHASMIALGIAMAQPDRKVFCLDGDGASIMQMGNMAIVGQSSCGNLTHIVFNNSAHDSVGGQPTVGGNIDLPAIAKACGYRIGLGGLEGLEKVWQRGGEGVGGCAPTFLEIKVAKGARKDLGRPKEAPQVNKALFMEILEVKA